MSYSATLSIDYPARDLDKGSTFFRFFYAIPIIIVISLIGASESGATGDKWGFTLGAAGSILFLPVLLMIVFRQKYPRWWFDFNLLLMRFTTRVFAYFALMSDEHPSTDEEQYVHLEPEYPDAKEDSTSGCPW